MSLLSLHDAGILPSNSGQQNTAAWHTAWNTYLSDPECEGWYVPTAERYNFYRNIVVGEKVHPIRITNSPKPFLFLGNGGTLAIDPAVWSLPPDQGDTHLIYLDKSPQGGTFRGLRLCGSYSERQPGQDWPNQQWHGLYLGAVTGNTRNVTIDKCEIWDMRGDGVFILGLKSSGFNISKVIIERNYIHDCERSGVAHQYGIEDLTEAYNYIERISDQAFDYEVSGAAGDKALHVAHIHHNIIKWDNDSLAVALTGNAHNDLGRDIQFHHNIILNGHLVIGSLQDSQIHHNIIIGGTTRRAFEATGQLENVEVTNNLITNKFAGGGSGAMTFDSAAYKMIGVRVVENTIHNEVDLEDESPVYPYGLVFRGNLQEITAENNTIYGQGGGFGMVYDLTTPDSKPHYGFDVEDNKVWNFGTGMVIGTRDGNTPYDGVVIHGNKFRDNQEIPTQLTAVHLNTEQGGLPGILNLMIADNQYGRGITTRLINAGGRQKYWATGENTFNCYGSPEGVITAPVGGEATRLDGTAGSFVYRKMSGTGAAGWVAIH